MIEPLERPSEYAPDRVQERRCSRCGEFKSIDEFPIKKVATGLRRTWCRPCCREYGKEHYRRTRPIYMARSKARRRADRPRIVALVDDYLRNHPCVDCGCTDLTVLEFDHRDGVVKREAVSRLKSSFTWTAILREIAKCDVRCANCHRRRTAAQFGWSKLKGLALAPGVARPGTAGRYRSLATARQELLFDRSVNGLRRCSRCSLLKSPAEFALRDMARGLPDYYCRQCRRAYRRAHYEANRADYLARAIGQMRMKREDAVVLLHEYLRAHPCVDCGEADIISLEFDHRDPRTKVMDVAAMLGRRSWPTILAEIAKCDVVCANCHRKRTARQQGWKARVGERASRYGRVSVLAGVA